MNLLGFSFKNRPLCSFSDKFNYNLIMFCSVPTCRNPSLGLAIKARCGKVTGQKGDPGVISHVPESAKSVRE
jgi:hypothetical protein